nr:hypothetical protein BaRGS_009855 [Batillaria attramentaria]
MCDKGVCLCLHNELVASSTLDASAKIYAGRVDFIHSETYKVLSGLGTGSSKQGAEGEEDAEDGEQNGEEQKKKKKTRKSRTVETNLKNINVNKFDLEFEVDPMFQVMSATFDEGGASGLLLNHLRCYDDQQLLVLDSRAVMPVVEDKTGDAMPDSQSQSQPKPVEVAEVKDLLEKMGLEDKHICPALKDFRLTGWDASADMSSVLPKGLSEFAFDPHTEPEPFSAVEDDLGSLPGDLDAADLHDISDGDVDGGDADDGGGGENTSQHLSQMRGDGHTAEFIQNAFNDLTKFKASKATALTKATLQKYSKKKTTLPEDLHFQADKLFRLFLRHKIMIKRQVTDAIGVDDGIQNYDYDNANDRENYCPDMGGDDDDVSQDLGFNFSDDSRGFNSEIEDQDMTDLWIEQDL